jgi:hypothetical protein
MSALLKVSHLNDGLALGAQLARMLTPLALAYRCKAPQSREEVGGYSFASFHVHLRRPGRLRDLAYISYGAYVCLCMGCYARSPRSLGQNHWW